MKPFMSEAGAHGSQTVGKASHGYAIFAVLYTLLIVYCAIVPFHFVPLDPSVAWQRLLAMPYVEHGSNQRADWMGNLLMLMPLGYALAVALATEERGRLLGGILALLLCVLVILAIKYLQLFFPPRTVSINYVVAQMAGAALGIAAQFALQRPLARIAATAGAGGRDALVALLWIYAAGLTGFILLPFDFVLSHDDLARRLAALPGLFFSLPGARLGPFRQTLLLAAFVLETMPIGVLWTLLNPEGRYAAVVFAVICAAAASFAAVFVMGAQPTAVGTVLRAVGIVVGAIAAQKAARRPLGWYVALIDRAVPWLAIAYLIILVPANSIRLGNADAPAILFYDMDPRIWIPLYLWYNSGKGTVAFAIAAHALLYLPLGLFMWRRPLIAALAAVIVSAIMEFGRLWTGLQPDPNNLLVAAIAAGGASRLGPIVWGWLTDRAASTQRT